MYNFLVICFDKVCKCNAIMKIHKCYQLGSHRSNFDHNKSHFNIIYQHKDTPDTCQHIVCGKIGGNDYIQGMFGSWVSNCKSN